MPTMRFNHMELTFPRGTLTTELREEIDAFYGSVFGWTGVDTEVVGQMCHILLSEEAQQFILLAESDKPMQSPGYDHLGLLFSTRAEVDDKLEQCKRYQEKDDRVRIKEYDDLVISDLTTYAFYVKYLLPIYFDVQCMERAGQSLPNALS
jgi:predicted enzyme related to lactoylglutathione lyase